MSRSSNLTATVPLAQVQSGVVICFKGSGQVIDLFSHFVDEGFTVGKVRDILAAQGVDVHRDTLRAGMNDMVKMGFLEKLTGEKTERFSALYRRRLTEAQREFRRKERERALPGLKKKPLAAAVAASCSSHSDG
jgi:hypothetical protein